MYSIHFIPAITKPTRFSNNSSSLIDHIWINLIVEYTSGIVLSDITDHCATILKLPFFVQKTHSEAKVKITFRDESESNKLSFSNTLSSFDWNSVFSENVDTYVQKFSNILFELYCTHFPLKTKQVSSRTVMCTWMSKELLQLVKYKSLYYKLFLKGFISKSQNNSFRNKVKSIVEKTKKDYYRAIFERNKNNIKSTWKIIRNITSYQPKVNIKEIFWKNKTYSEEGTIADVFNEYFSTIATDLDGNLGTNSIDPLSYLTRNSKSIFLSPVSHFECSNIIQILKNSNNPIDKIPPRIFKVFRQHLSIPISKIINCSFSKGIFPNLLKHAIVTPIHKKGDRCDPSNFRPISVTSFLSKIFEKLIFLRLSKFLLDCNILSPKQFGFKQHFSTQDALNSLVEYYYDVLDRKEIAVSVFIDYCKAFDTINHSILVRKLEYYGIRGLPLKLLTSYLRDRTQVVRIGSSFSSVKSVNIGIPQGTILGPILFILYINDLPKVIPNFHTVLFADDTTLSFSHSNFSHLICQFNHFMFYFYEWSVANRLSINYQKTNCMIITKREVPCDSSEIFINQKSIKFVSSVKYLGVILDKNLKFNEHIKSISLKISKSTGIMHRLRSLVPFIGLRSIYFSLVNSYLQYCLTVWGGTSRCHLQPLIILQKRAIRIVCNVSILEHTNHLFYQTKILKLDEMYILNLCVLAFSQKINFSRRFHSYSTRYRENLLPQFHRLSLTQQSCSFSAVYFWNSLPKELRNLSSLTIFKKD